MPWYMNPKTTCRVMNRIASRYSHAPLKDVQAVLDLATQRLWHKQEYYYEKSRHTSSGNVVAG